MNNQQYSSKTSKKKSNENLIQVGQFDLFGNIEGIDKLIDPEPRVIEQDGIRVVGVIIPRSKTDLPGYIPEALKQGRALVPEVQTSGKPPWMSAKWQTNKRKRRAK